ncbi:MAG: DUF1905 domain-containing protein [Chitinophagaceae bacterium]|nr:DUF1905 domain-containing protein [Chitinophagaceae bacterium]
MQVFTSSIKKFGDQGEKTGWSYLEVPAEIAELLNPGCKKSYRVKGKLDNHVIEKTSLIPMGDGSFIIPLNATMRKAIGKNKGAMVKLHLSEDKRELEISPELIECLKDEPGTLERFQKQPGSHQRYFSKWIVSAKTEQTKAKRIAMTVRAMVKGFNYSEMMRESRNKDT